MFKSLTYCKKLGPFTPLTTSRSGAWVSPTVRGEGRDAGNHLSRTSFGSFPVSLSSDWLNFFYPSMILVNSIF